MSAFLYGVALQWRLDIRSKSLLITCYLVPLLFFALMGGVFTSINPEAKETLIQSMTVMGVSMGALIGLPPSLAELCRSEIKKVYQANGVPLCFGVVSTCLSSFVHLLLMSVIILLTAPLIFGAPLPTDLPLYFAGLALLIAVSLGIGCVLGLAVKQQAKLTMVSQIAFLPSIILSGIMFPVDLLPLPFEIAGKLFPAAWGFRLMSEQGFRLENLWYPLVLLIAAAGVSGLLLKRSRQG